MKKTLGYRDKDREMEIKMTPMIDIVFLLLVFFVWTASFHLVEDSLPTSVTAELGESESTEIPEDIEFEDPMRHPFEPTVECMANKVKQLCQQYAATTTNL